MAVDESVLCGRVHQSSVRVCGAVCAGMRPGPGISVVITRTCTEPIVPPTCPSSRFSTTLSWQMRVPEGTQKIIVDSPAAVEARAMPELTRDANKVIVPVLPSDIDIHAASRCIADLLLVAKIKRAENRTGVVANRVRKNTLMFQALMRFLEKLDIPVIATIRDSQNYVRAAEQGVGIHEMKAYTVREDLAQWETLLAWLEPERVLAEQPAPMQEQPAPAALPVAAEAAIEPKSDETGAHDARFVIGS